MRDKGCFALRNCHQDALGIYYHKGFCMAELESDRSCALARVLVCRESLLSFSSIECLIKDDNRSIIVIMKAETVNHLIFEGC